MINDKAELLYEMSYVMITVTANFAHLYFD